jgi:galactokinase/mevalonate kinase-like predicted kinase
VSSRVIEATAPTRVDLAGGGLDGWPAQALSGAVAIDVAIDRRAWCRVETGVDGVEIESRDRVQKASGRTVADVVAAGRLTLAAHVLQALGVATGVRVVTQSRVPAGSGLGDSAALAVAVAAAVARALDKELEPEAVATLAREAESRAAGAPVGIRGFHAALHGGVVALHAEAAAVRVERLAVDPARVEESLTLFDAGPLTLADAPGGAPDPADASVRAALSTIAAVAPQVREALLAARFEDLVDLLAAEQEARRPLTSGPAAARAQRVAEVVRSGGGAARTCGSGSVVAVWAPPGSRAPGRREAVLEAAKQAGLRVFPARVDLRGLEVESAA